jgi:hypothetical protein
MNVLVIWIQNLNENHILKPIYIGCRSCLLLTNDTLILIKHTTQQLNIMKLILDIFGSISRLKINMQKSELLVISMAAHYVEQLASTIQCKSSIFPLKYLGLSLSDKGVSRQQYKKLIDSIQDALPRWQTTYLSITGRGVLINVILSAKPVYFMSLYLLPKWVIKTGRFLWHGHKQDDKKSMCLIRWIIVTMSKKKRDCVSETCT